MRIFITGASDGIGKALAKQLTADGHLVWGVARRKELLERLQSEIGADKFLFSVCDVGNEEESKSVLREMRQKDFLPEVAVLNAAAFLSDTDSYYNHSLLVKAFRVNVFGALFWVEAFLPDFLKRGSGKFIAISSVAAYRPNPKSISLSASKAALSMAFRGLRLRYQKDNIGFSNVYFGPIATNLVPAWSSAGGQPRYFFVLSPEKAAKKIIKVLNGKAGDYWFPFFTTFIFRLVLLMPDRVFAAITQYLKNNGK